MNELSSAFLQLGDALGWTGLVLSPLLLLPIAVLILPASLTKATGWMSELADRASEVALRTAMLATLCLVIVQLTVIIFRYVYGISFAWLSETVIYLFATIFMLGAAATLRDDGHVRVDILREKMGPKTRAAVDIAGIYLFVFPVCVLILNSVRPSLARSWAQFEGSREASGLPILFLFKTLIPVLAVLLIIQALGLALRAAQRIRSTGEAEDVR